MTDLTQQLTQLEGQYWQAMQDHNLDAALELTDFPCLIAGPHGAMAMDKKTYTELFESHKEDLQSYRFKKPPQVRLLTPTTAVVAYEVEATIKVSGEMKKIEAADTSTWVQRDGLWRCAMHSEALLMPRQKTAAA